MPKPVLRWEYFEFAYTQYGVPWRLEAAQVKLEQMEREGWTIVMWYEAFILLRRLR